MARQAPQARSGAGAATALLAPRYWRTWLAVGALRAAAWLPFRVQVVLGRGLGALLYVLMRRRRHIARVNLGLCFPELGERERSRLLSRHFQALGVAMFEFPSAWWGSARRLRGLFRVQGLEHLDAALQRGHGAILLGAHFLTLEIALRGLLFHRPCHMMYRPTKNAVLERVVRRARAAHPVRVYPRENVRELLRSLRENHPVWYAPDQDYGRRHSVFVPFFGVPAATITVTSRFARSSGAPVLPFLHHRLPGARGYEVTIGPPLEGFPSGDDAADARRINAIIEEQVRRSPEQYLWVHRRFKTRPRKGEDPYGV